ncbi:MAG: hypothetical protein KDN05_22005, partial [Verrucomicrobiae bacterium]|nr:hypothetical protein [Verrucomicrobiae bacterium]
MKSITLVVAACAAVSSAQGAVLTTLPTPVQQGGMIHINISLQGSDLVAHPESGTPVIQPLAAWSPGNT